MMGFTSGGLSHIGDAIDEPSSAVGLWFLEIETGVTMLGGGVAGFGDFARHSSLRVVREFFLALWTTTASLLLSLLLREVYAVESLK